MNYKKIIFAISFLIVFGFIFNAGVPNAKAATVAELQALIQQLQQQIVTLQQRLSQLQSNQQTWCHNFNVNLKIGMEGSDIRALQTALQKEGLYKRDITGNFDEYTASVVTGFQEKYASEILAPWGLKYGTGFVGKTTRTKLNDLYGCKLSPTPPSNCHLLWWYDSNHQFCQQKQFCGEYMYLGLRTFQTKAECEASLNPTEQSITILSPNGGEKWIFGTNYGIRWAQTGMKDKKVDILLKAYDKNYSPFNAEYLIASAVSASKGVYYWTPSQQVLDDYFGIVVPRYYYKVIIRTTETPVPTTEIRDESDNYFSIVSSTTCTDTDGGENYYARGIATDPDTGKSFTDYCLTSSTLREYFCLSPSSVFPRGSVAQGDYTCPSGYTCEDGACVKGGKYIRVLSPNGGEQWIYSGGYSIDWTQRDLENEKVDILLAAFDHNYRQIKDWYVIATDIPATQGTFTWIPSPRAIDNYFGYVTLPPYFKIKIRTQEVPSGNESEVSDISDNYFQINLPGGNAYVKVFSPNGGEQWQQGDTYTIKWQSWPMTKVNIYLEDWSNVGAGGPVTVTIAKDVSADAEEYSWTISPEDFPVGDAYRVEIEDASDSSVNGRSDGNFSIVGPGGLGLENIESQVANISQVVDELVKEIGGLMRR